MVAEIKNAIQIHSSKEEMETNHLILDMVDKICRKEIEPYARKMDQFGTQLKGESNISIHPQMAKIIQTFQQNDLYGLAVPSNYNGSGLGQTLNNAVIERVSRADASTRSYLSLQGTIIDFLLRYGSEELKYNYIPNLATGHRFGGLLLTESSSGSDLGSIKTRAIRDGDNYVVNGQKIFITNCHISDTYMLLASTDPGKGSHGLTTFLLDTRNQPGFKVISLEHKLGIRASPTGTITLENVQIPVENRVGEENQGFSIALSVLTASRISVAAGATGIADAAFRKALAYAKDRFQFGKSILKFQANQFKIADMATKIHLARNYYLYASRRKDMDQTFSTEAAIAKLYATEMAQKVTYDAIQLHGGYGFIVDYDVERYYRDVRITTLFEGTSEIQRLIISRNEINNHVQKSRV